MKPLTFKGDKKPKKRKRTHAEGGEDDGDEHPDRGAVARRTTDAPDEATGEDDSWVSAEAVGDIAGPIVFALPSDPPAALSSDAVGKIFALPLENILEGNLATAEPHDVRQVWIANRVAGTESFSFKGHHGRYLSCDKFGILSASREAVSQEESFLCIPVPDSPGTFSIQTTRETFIAISTSSPPEIRGDASDIKFNTTFRIRMQARFKPRLKASKEEKAKEKISRKELEEAVGRRLDDEEVKKLKRARRAGNYHEVLLDVRVRGKHDKFAS